MRTAQEMDGAESPASVPIKTRAYCEPQHRTRASRVRSTAHGSFFSHSKFVRFRPYKLYVERPARQETKQWEQMRVPTRPYSGMLEETRLPDEGMLVQYKIGFVVRFW